MNDNQYYYCVVTDDYDNSITLSFNLYGIFNDTHENVSFDTAEEIGPGDSKEVTLSPGKPYAYYKFVPDKTGLYVFYSESDDDTYGSLYDSSEERITYSDDFDNSRDFRIEYELTAGETYYFLAKYYYDSNAGRVAVHLIEKTLIVEDWNTERWVNSDEEVTLSIDAQSGNSAAITYTWTIDGEAVDCKDSIYTFVPDKNCKVECAISNGPETVKRYCSIIIENNLTVFANITGLQENDDSIIEAQVAYNQPVELRADAKAINTSGMTYQWLDAGEFAIEGATSPTYTIGAVTSKSEFGCSVKDKYGNTHIAWFNVNFLDN